MILYEVSGSRLGSSFFRKLKDARVCFEKQKTAGNDVDLSKVEVEISAERQIELLNGYWSNARTTIAEIDRYNPYENWPDM